VTEAQRRRASILVRVALGAFVLVWLFGPYAVRSLVPIWLPFLVALGLELHFFVGAIREPAYVPRGSDRGPQPGDRERFGYGAETDELLLVRDGGEELWIPYAGESPEEVEALVAAARERAARGEEQREPEPVPHAVGRPQPVRRLLVALVVMGAVAAGAWAIDSRSGWNGVSPDGRAEAEALFSREASRIAGHGVSVHCDVSGRHVGAVHHADGVAVVGGTVAYLTPDRCYDLYRVAFEHDTSFSGAGRGIAVLAHEAWHLRGVADEGETQCHALQSGVELAQRLGVAGATARRLMRQQAVESEELGRVAPEYQLPPGCRVP
jgi:hypothetical protein